MKCVVINLTDQAARWAAMAAQLVNWPFPVRRFEAIQNADLNTMQLAALYSISRNRQQYHQPLTAGEIGCYASHVAVWRSLLETDDSCVAVFEDDVTLHGELPAVLRAVERLDSDWSILKLIGRDPEKVSDTWPWIPGHRLLRYRRIPNLCSAYVISRNGAQRLLSTHVPFGRPADIDLRYWWESGCRILGVAPYPVSKSQFSHRSTIGDRDPSWRPAVKLRRLILRCDYNFKNWQANRRFVPGRFTPGATVLAGALMAC